MPVSVRDVARVAGVSIATVSHVLNNKGAMTDATRQRVLDAIRTTGYRRQRRASGDLIFIHRGGKFGTQWLLQAAAEHGFSVQVMNCGDTPDIPQSFATGRRIAGAVVYGGLWPRSFLEQIASRYPTVLMGSYLPTSRSDAVWVDNAGGIYSAVDYLISQGHRCIGLVNGPSNSATSAEKRVGFEWALRHAGLQDCGIVVEAKDFEYPSGREAVRQLLSHATRPTAIVAGETVFGLAAVDVCAELGLSIPADLSLIVFRDDPRMEQCRPPVSCIRIPEPAICREAINRLVLRIGDHGAAGKRVLLQPELVHRASVASREQA